jgi:CubicO group peptidase (beta-lactamase class C family)
VPLEFGLIPAGALYTSVEDMEKFIQFHLNDGVVGNKQILEKRYLEEMYTVPFPVKDQIEGYALGIDKKKKYDSWLWFPFEYDMVSRIWHRHDFAYKFSKP